MFDRKEKNAEIFKDTERMYRSNKILKDAVEHSIQNQRLILATDPVDFEPPDVREGKVVVSGKRTLEASGHYAKRGKRVCVLNFASATNPGGGVVHGSSAQEEAICRCSTLYPCLNTKNMLDSFYTPHKKANNPLYNNDCIFTPAVKVFKGDTNFPKTLAGTEWWAVDVITCAAPNLRRVPSNAMNPNAGSKRADITFEGLKALHTGRIQRIFEVALANKADVLILGAFGCGAFCNPPELVAEIFAEFTEKYRQFFDTIEYAVFHTERDKKNYEAFQKAMRRYGQNA